MLSNNTLYDSVISLIQILKTTSFDDLKYIVLNAPTLYKDWWLGLYRDAPHHIIVETLLVMFIIWLIFIRKTIDPVRESKNKSLSKKEEEWLISTWNPQPLVEPENQRTNMISNSMMVIYNYRFLFYCLISVIDCGLSEG
jgi:hypothetical protein